jgi:hypothetical protein
VSLIGEFSDQVESIVVKRSAAANPKPEAPDSTFDLEDALLVAGILFLEAGSYFIWRVLPLILAGSFCLAFLYLIERAKHPRPKREKPKRRPRIVLTPEQVHELTRRDASE